MAVDPEVLERIAALLDLPIVITQQDVASSAPPVPQVQSGVPTPNISRPLRFAGVNTLNELLRLYAAAISALATMGPSGPAGGDLAGTYPDPTVAAFDVLRDAAAATVIAADGAGSLTFAKFPRVFEAVVAADGTGDYLLPSEAFADGARSVWVRRGTYVETADIELTVDHSALCGESGAIIDLSGGFQVVVQPSELRLILGGGANGTLTVATGSDAVSGTGTTFTGLESGDYLVIAGVPHEIAEITSDTALTLVSAYQGVPQALTAQWIGMSAITTPMIGDVQLVDAPGTALVLNQAVDAEVNSLRVLRGGAPGVAGVAATNCSILSYNRVVSRDGAGRGFSLVNVGGVQLQSCAGFNNAEHGLFVDGLYSRAVTCELAVMSQNGGNGVLFGASGPLEAGFNDSWIHQNAGGGIETNFPIGHTNVGTTEVCGNGGMGVIFRGIDDSFEDGQIKNNLGGGIQPGNNTRLGDLAIKNNGVGFPAVDGTATATAGISLVLANCLISASNVGGAAIDLANNIALIEGTRVATVGATIGMRLAGNNIRVTGCEIVRASGPLAGTGILISGDECGVGDCRTRGYSVGINVTAAALRTIVGDCNNNGNTTALINAGAASALSNNIT